MTTQVKDKLSIKDHIRNAFLDAKNRWLFTGEIHAGTPNVNRQSVYSVVSSMANNLELERRSAKNTGSGFEYRLFKNTYQELKQQKEGVLDAPTAKETSEEEPVLLQTENQNLVLETSTDETSDTGVIVVEAGVRARKKSVFWDRDDRLEFCVNYLKAKRDNPAIGFCSAAMLAQKSMSEMKRKANLVNKSQLTPWFEAMLEEAQKILAKQEIELAEKETARLMEEKRINEEARREADRKVADSTNLIQGLTSEMLMGEILRRGTSLIETMLIQSLQSPRVRDALANAVADRRPARAEVRHNPEAPVCDRPRLKKLLIFGLNKPIHQNEIIRDFKDMFDVRVLAAKPNGATLKAMSRAAEEIIVMKNHVDHGSTDTMVADNLKLTYVAGNVGVLRDFLIKKFTDEEAEK